jgi:DNA-binding transcriptional ArsR family regulator
MTMSKPPSASAVPCGDLNPVIHERVRLGIMSLLAAARELPFNDVKGALGLTDGNLSVHMRLLEKHGYVTVDKSFVLRRPRTVLRLSRAGRRAFEEYLRVLERVTQAGRK